MKMAKTVTLVFFISSMAHAVDSTDAMSVDLEYCKVPYTDTMDGSSGTYRGQCKNGKPNGSGSVDFFNGSRLAGTFKKGALAGNGVYTSADGNIYKGG